jgi:hypothetical protein
MNKNDKEITLFIKSIFGNYNISTYLRDTIAELKLKIKEKIRLPICNINLIYGSNILTNCFTIEDYNILDCSTLILNTNLRGGMYHETSGRAGNFQKLKNNILIIDDLDKEIEEVCLIKK